MAVLDDIRGNLTEGQLLPLTLLFWSQLFEGWKGLTLGHLRPEEYKYWKTDYIWLILVVSLVIRLLVATCQSCNQPIKTSENNKQECDSCPGAFVQQAQGHPLASIMSSKCNFCAHCREFVSDRTYRRHSDLRGIESSDEEENEHLLKNFLQNNDDFPQNNEVPGEAHEVVDDRESLPGNADIFYVTLLV